MISQEHLQVFTQLTPTASSGDGQSWLLRAGAPYLSYFVMDVTNRVIHADICRCAPYFRLKIIKDGLNDVIHLRKVDKRFFVISDHHSFSFL